MLGSGGHSCDALRVPLALLAAASIALATASGCGGGETRRGSAPHEFGTNGKVVIQGDGKIVAVIGADPSSNSFRIARCTPDRKLDTRFGASGNAVADFHSRYGAGTSAVALEADHKIVAFGWNLVTYPDRCFGAGTFALARFLPDGRLDQSFGTGGSVCRRTSAPAKARSRAPSSRMARSSPWGRIVSPNLLPLLRDIRRMGASTRPSARPAEL